MALLFKKLLEEILTNESGENIESVAYERLSEILSDNGFEKDADVPEWLMSFFTALKTKESFGPTPLPETQTEADVWEFFCDLQDLTVLDCFDYGEWIRLRLPNHDILGIISIEHNFYQVKKLSVISVDGLSDISQAKILNREET